MKKVVCSRTLDRVEGNAELARGEIGEVVAGLEGELGVGGAGLGASFLERGLVDELGLFVYPVLLGRGTPFFPAHGARTDLRLAETRTFGSGVVYLRYELMRKSR